MIYGVCTDKNCPKCKKGRGGKREGAGRKPIYTEAMEPFTLMLTKQQREMIGLKAALVKKTIQQWLRDLIESE